MYEEFLAQRLVQLRQAKGVSAREMSLDIGQNSSYINRIESGKAMPSMQCFFYICEYLHVTPSEFFDAESADPARAKQLAAEMRGLRPEQMKIVQSLVADMRKLNH